MYLDMLHICNADIVLNDFFFFSHRNLRVKFEEMLREAGALTGSPLVVFIDGLDLMEPAYMPHTLDWLPEAVPKVD